jgi:general secretion pathway protein I
MRSKESTVFLEKKSQKTVVRSRIFPGEPPTGTKCFFASFFSKTTGLPSGFTLLEVLIAFVIASLAIGALFEGTVAGLDATSVSAKYDEAVSLAKSHLAGIGHGTAVAPQETSGADGEGFVWHLRIREIGSRELNLSDQDRANDLKPSRAVLYSVTVTESWKAGGRERQVTLSTKRFDVRTAEAG